MDSRKINVLAILFFTTALFSVNNTCSMGRVLHQVAGVPDVLSLPCWGSRRFLSGAIKTAKKTDLGILNICMIYARVGAAVVPVRYSTIANFDALIATDREKFIELLRGQLSYVVCYTLDTHHDAVAFDGGASFMRNYLLLKRCRDLERDVSCLAAMRSLCSWLVMHAQYGLPVQRFNVQEMLAGLCYNGLGGGYDLKTAQRLSLNLLDARHFWNEISCPHRANMLYMLADLSYTGQEGERNVDIAREICQTLIDDPALYGFLEFDQRAHVAYMLAVLCCTGQGGAQDVELACQLCQKLISDPTLDGTLDVSWRANIRYMLVNLSYNRPPDLASDMSMKVVCQDLIDNQNFDRCLSSEQRANVRHWMICMLADGRGDVPETPTVGLELGESIGALLDTNSDWLAIDRDIDAGYAGVS